MAPGSQPIHAFGLVPRDIWDELTSAIGNAMNGGGDEATTSTSTSAKHTTTSSDKTTTTKEAATTTSQKTTTTAETKATSTATTATKTSTKTTATTSSTTSSSSSSKSTSSSSSATLVVAQETTSSSDSLTFISVSSTSDVDSVLTLATTTPTTTSTTSATPTSATPSATSTSTSSSSSTSTGTKAGIAFGVIGGVFVISLLVFFLFRRHQKRADRQRLDDEKDVEPFGNHSVVQGGDNVAANSPRLSLRPVTQLFPSLAAGGVAAAGAAQQRQNQQDPFYPDRRASRGMAIAMQNQPPMANRPGTANSWEQQPTGLTSPNSNVNNPFRDAAELPVVASSDEPRSLTSAAGAGAASMTRKTSMRKGNTNPLDLTLAAPNRAGTADAPPASPVGTEFSFSSMTTDQAQGPSASGAAIAAAGGPAVSTVHRVQLDFKPTLEDELELRAGQLVRLLHEYDDGWALCIRLDRSRQGVVPRTCLSTRPVKPRAGPSAGRPGPPVNPNMNSNKNRPTGPMGPMGPMNQQWPMHPMGPVGPMGPGRGNQPQPQPPIQGRPASPAMRNQAPYPTGDRPQSPSNMSMPQPMQSPPAGSPLGGRVRSGPIGRKPVPGQAY